MKREHSEHQGEARLGTVLFLFLGLAILAVAFFVIRDRLTTEPEGPDLDNVLRRERVAHWFKKSKLTTARELLEPLVSGSDARSGDLLRAATIEYSLSEADKAEEFLARAEKLDPDSPALHFLRGQIARESGEPEKAVTALRRARDLAPDDLPTMYILAQALQDLDEFGEAEQLLRRVVDGGIEHGGSWYVSALYGLERLLILDGREEQAEPLSKRRIQLMDAGIGALSSQKTRLGTFGQLSPPEPTGTFVPEPGSSLAFEASELDLPLLAGALELGVHDIDGDGRLDLLARLPDGIAIAIQGPDGWQEQRVYEGPVSMVRAFDLDNEPEADLELLIVTGEELRILEQGEEGWKPLAVQFPELPDVPADIEPLDFDHEGDIDLLVVGSFGARLWRNDGAWVVDAQTPGAYVDATETASLPQDVNYAWAVSEDFDGDNDVDLLIGGSGDLYLADSLRAGRFADASGRFPAGTFFPTKPLIADFDGDKRPDVYRTGADSMRLMQRRDLSFEAQPTTQVPAPRPLMIDLDLDGALDLVWDSQALLAVGLEHETPVSLFDTDLSEAVLSTAALDINDDRKPDIVHSTSAGLHAYTAVGERGNSMSIVLRGNRSNRRGLGSIVEIRSGGIYRRIFYRGEPLDVGVGPAKKLDIIRITYPNGISLSEIDVALDSEALIDDPAGAFDQFTEPGDLIGSCPFLYTWNGERYEFISDVLGITPLGLPMAPGMMVPPDHDEFVLVRGDQLKAQDGLLTLQFTEELREVTYLDRVRLDVVDHPLDTTVYPNELFKFPPFPEEHLHSVREPQAVLKATASDGKDWTRELAYLDDDHAIPFTKQPPQFQGLAQPWFLELEFDPEALRDAEKLRLVLTGWFFWSDASANIAAAGHPGVDFIPPIFQVPDGEGGWRATGPPVGFPAGKTKTMLVDVSDIGLQRVPRMRIFTTLQLFWDRIVLATDDDDGPRSIVSLEPASAVLSRRGFSAPIATENPGLPSRFDWEVLSANPRWNPHPGKYTRLGQCHELLHEVDDHYVIMGSGEALEVQFDASGLPPVPDGYQRDYLVFLDGWAKDRDHNTLEALEVTPLPFHGMSGYPYGDDEHFPDTPGHMQWQREWNTREAQDWILPIADED